MSEPGRSARVLSSRPVHAGRVVALRVEEIELPSGRRSTLELVHHPGAAAIVPIDAAGEVLLVRQYRHATGGEWLLEVPAGKLDPGETPLATAKRELREEAGYEARAWTRLGAVHTVLSYSTEVIDLWLAEDLTHVGAALDPGEFLDVASLRYDDVLAMLDAGTITDVKTVAALCHLERRRAARAPRARVLRIRGRVQGVGFREGLVAQARLHGLAGWVRNRADDTVEALVQGAPDALERVVDWARRGPPAARVDGVEVHEVAPDAGLAGFERRPTR